MNGVLIVNKETGCTSRDVVNQVSKILNIKKIGHTGTLDPLATGVLILCIGKYTKLVNFLTSKDKEYIATMRLGMQTDTLDITGNILKEEQVSLSKDKICEVFAAFPHQYLQEVPIYSAVKVDGKKLYEYAREKKSVKLPKREVMIETLEIMDIKGNDITFKTKVSKGTYIRSLINDLATNLNTVATMTSLVRTKQGNFSIDSSYKIQDIKNDNYQLIDIKDLFKEYETREIDDEYAQKLKNGILIPYDFKDYVVFTNNNQNIAIYEQYEKDESKAKPLIIF